MPCQRVSRIRVSRGHGDISEISARPHSEASSSTEGGGGRVIERLVPVPSREQTRRVKHFGGTGEPPLRGAACDCSGGGETKPTVDVFTPNERRGERQDQAPIGRGRAPDIRCPLFSIRFALLSMERTAPCTQGGFDGVRMLHRRPCDTTSLRIRDSRGRARTRATAAARRRHPVRREVRPCVATATAQ